MTHSQAECAVLPWQDKTPWQLIEIDKLAEQHTLLEFAQQRQDVKVRVAAELARPDSKGRSMTFDALLSEIAEAREPTLQRAAAEVCLQFANVADQKLRQEYEAALSNLGRRCSDYMLEKEKRRRSEREEDELVQPKALEQEQGHELQPQQETVPVKTGEPNRSGDKRMSVVAHIRRQSLIAQAKQQAHERRVSSQAQELEPSTQPQKTVRAQRRRSTAIFAEWSHSRRRSITTRYKHLTPYPLRHYIFYVNLERYRDPIGLDWQSACDKYENDYSKIIKGASRANGDVNALLKGFHKWLLLQSAEYVHDALDFVKAQKEATCSNETAGPDETPSTREMIVVQLQEGTATPAQNHAPSLMQRLGRWGHTTRRRVTKAWRGSGSISRSPRRR
jgi:hypothetical protein